MQELKAIHRSGHHRLPRVAHGGHGGGDIDQVHDGAAENIAEGIVVIGERELRVFGGRFAHGFVRHQKLFYLGGQQFLAAGFYAVKITCGVSGHLFGQRRGGIGRDGPGGG